MMAHVYNSSYSGGKGKRIMVQLGQKVQDPIQVALVAEHLLGIHKSVEISRVGDRSREGEQQPTWLLDFFFKTTCEWYTLSLNV
jgi:hypothetical protein